jgi:hypothetical protein
MKNPRKKGHTGTRSYVQGKKFLIRVIPDQKAPGNYRDNSDRGKYFSPPPFFPALGSKRVPGTSARQRCQRRTPGRTPFFTHGANRTDLSRIFTEKIKEMDDININSFPIGASV